MPESGARGPGGWYSVVREVGLALVTAGVVVLLFLAYDLFGTGIAAQHSQAKLAREFASALSHRGIPTSAGTPAGTPGGKPTDPSGRGTTGPARGAKQRHQAKPANRSSASHHQAAEVALPVTPPGGALDHIVIPAIGVNRYVVQGVAEQDLQMGPGHYPGTPLPGQVGNVGIAGHRTTYGAPFFRLNALGKGDLIYLTDLSGTTWVYSVERQWVVSPSDVAVLDPTRGADLTLTTCNPRFWATTRLVVRAALVEHLDRGAKFQGQLPVSLASKGTKGGVPTGTLGSVAAGQSGTGGVPATAASGGTPPSGTPSAAEPAAGGSRRGGGSPVVGNGSLALGGSGTGTWVMAFGFGALAVAAWVAARLLAARRRRYAKLAFLLGGVLVCLVPLWFAFGAVVDLLPANF